MKEIKCKYYQKVISLGDGEYLRIDKKVTYYVDKNGKRHQKTVVLGVDDCDEEGFNLE